jgi:WLM domain
MSNTKNSNSISCYLLLFCTILILMSLTKSGFFDRTVHVEVNSKKYPVIYNFDNKVQAAEILHEVDNNILRLKEFINNKFTEEYIETESKLFAKGDVLRKIKKRLNSTYTSGSLKENYPKVAKSDVSYNLNKGSTIALCLRDYEDSEQFHDFNEIMFVTLHELAHSLNCNENALMCGNSYGHDEMFWYIFKLLLENAIECGIYKKKNYRENPVDYCSMGITYSPLYDKTLEDKHFYD